MKCLHQIRHRSLMKMCDIKPPSTVSSWPSLSQTFCTHCWPESASTLFLLKDYCGLVVVKPVFLLPNNLWCLDTWALQDTQLSHHSLSSLFQAALGRKGLCWRYVCFSSFVLKAGCLKNLVFPNVSVHKNVCLLCHTCHLDIAASVKLWRSYVVIFLCVVLDLLNRSWDLMKDWQNWTHK